MLLGEPAPTQADLHFRLFGFPVRVHPLFWLVTVLLAVSGSGSDPVDVLVWVGVVFVSILVHELGHAFLQRHFGGHPWITLYSFGGLASCNDCDRRPRNQILILLAGPFAGFFLAAAILIGLNLSGHQAGFTLADEASEIMSNLQALPVPIVGKLYTYFQPIRSDPVTLIIYYSLYVNILWGILNLLPIYPLDGGQISRELFSLQNPRAGTLQSLQLSAGTAVLVAAYALLNQRVFTGIMFGILAYENFQSIQFHRSHWR